MRIGIAKLRVWLLVSAALLLAVVTGFIGTARYLRRHWLDTLPAKLGANVKVDTSGITWSHTYKGQTDYIVHAGRDVEHADGKVALHDVWMKLCGREQKRSDIVRGDEWEWDKKANVIRALGVVHIELRDADGGKLRCTASDDTATDGSGAKMTRVTTSNLIYMQDLRLAVTSAPIEFASGTMEGHAVGADYASDSGTLMLHSAVSMKGMSAEQPVTIEAASAEMDGLERVARLTDARYTMGAADTLRTAEAQNAVLHLRSDKTLERIEAQGNVTMRTAAGSVSAAKANVAMNAAGHPVNAVLTGGVRYAAQMPLTERHGEAQDAVVAFDGKASAQVEHAVFTGSAHMTERTRMSASSSVWNTRELAAAKLELALAPGVPGKNEVREVEASGGAKFSTVNAWKAPRAGGAVGPTAPETTEIAGDNLKAHFAKGAVRAGSRSQIETISGRGHTLVRQVNGAGVEQTSAGDELEVGFLQHSASGKKAGDAAQTNFASVDDIANAVQTGAVQVTRRDSGKNAKDGEERATAQRAAYDGDTDRMTLNGGTQLSDTGSHLWANQVVIERKSGNAMATGAVKVEYEEDEESTRKQSAQNNAEPMHVLAERADMDHATGTATFHGTPVRMWQAGSRIEAPVIEVGRTPKRLFAHGGAVGGRDAQVHAVLMSGGSDVNAPGNASGTKPCAVNAGAGNGRGGIQGAAEPQVTRIDSGGLVYTDASGEADFTGGFRAEVAEATVRAETGTAYLRKKDSKVASTISKMPSLSGPIDRFLAKGEITIAQPGLHATGGQLLYTAAEQSFLLTGDAKGQPKAMDVRGNVTTGAALKFHRACLGGGGDTTVEVLNNAPSGPDASGGVHTEVLAEEKKGQPRK